MQSSLLVFFIVKQTHVLSAKVKRAENEWPSVVILDDTKPKFSKHGQEIIRRSKSNHCPKTKENPRLIYA